jgi:hypothetical protein
MYMLYIRFTSLYIHNIQYLQRTVNSIQFSLVLSCAVLNSIRATFGATPRLFLRWRNSKASRAAPAEQNRCGGAEGEPPPSLSRSFALCSSLVSSTLYSPQAKRRHPHRCQCTAPLSATPGLKLNLFQPQLPSLAWFP